MTAELQSMPGSASGTPSAAAGEVRHPSAGVVERWAPYWHPAAIFATSRVATLLAAAIAADLHPTFGLGGVLTGTWDSGWYLAVAQHGYPTAVPEQAGRAVQSTIGFFPLYPLLVRTVHRLGLSYPTAGLVVAGVAGVAACALLWQLVRHLSGPAVADRAVALFCFFPGALILSLPYSEALMLALSIGCLLALLRRHWITAGALAALATATRPNAVALVAACAWAAGAAVWRRREWRALAAPALAPLGLVAFFAYLGVHTGEVGAYLRTQREGWDQKLEPKSALDTISDFLHHPFADTNVTVMVVGVIFLIGMLVLLVRSRPPGILLVYTVAVMGMALLTPTMGARPRFLLTAFPLVTVLAEDLPAPVFSGVLATSATLLGAFTVLTMTSLLATP
jgi:hypothetical protein